MISKQNLLKKIDTLLNLKERITPLLNQHILTAISFSELKKDDQNMITEKFKAMAAQQVKHKQLLNDVKNSVTRGSGNAY